MPVNIMPVRLGINFSRLKEVIAENTKSSPIDLGKGGRPRLAHAKISHRRGRVKKIFFKPRFIFRVRVPLRS